MWKELALQSLFWKKNESHNQHNLKQLRGCNLLHCTQNRCPRTSPSGTSSWLCVVSTWPWSGQNITSLYPNNNVQWKNLWYQSKTDMTQVAQNNWSQTTQFLGSFEMSQLFLPWAKQIRWVFRRHTPNLVCKVSVLQWAVFMLPIVGKVSASQKFKDAHCLDFLHNWEQLYSCVG